MKTPKSGTQLVALAFTAFLLQACSEPVAWRGTDVSGILPDLEFTLTGSDGLETGADAFHGKATLLYFGFTSCPGVCPTTLNHVSVALDALGGPARNVHVLLVSVDPKRDTPEVMRKYTAGYGPWLHGLTGSEADLRA
ncbi:MAG: SCO family protein, partial [Xanthomonadales bacterium]|nr:SCO family protein [Xanthomonadales bacterium]NIX13163.1 SCO family protein [Xanthomonadales bacterium]